MKKLLLAFCLILPFVLFAQEKTDELDYKYHLQGTHSFNLGVGFPNKINSGFTVIDQLGIDRCLAAEADFAAASESIAPEVHCWPICTFL